MEEKKEYLKTSYGKKVVKIPIEELQSLELQLGFIPKEEADFFRLEQDRIIKIIAEKYNMKTWDVAEQYSFGRRKSVWNVLNIPAKELIHFHSLFGQISRNDVEHYRFERGKIIKQISEKYWLK